MNKYDIEKAKDEYYNRPNLGAWIAITVAMVVLFCMLVITIIYKLTEKPTEVKAPQNTYFAVTGEANKIPYTVIITTPNDANRGS